MLEFASLVASPPPPTSSPIPPFSTPTHQQHTSQQHRRPAARTALPTTTTPIIATNERDVLDGESNHSPDAEMSSADSAVSSSSGKNGGAYSDFREYVRSRRQTITSRLPINRIMAPLGTANCATSRKMSIAGIDDPFPSIKKPSVDSQFFEGDNVDNMEESVGRPASFNNYHRRLSVPERSLFNANYAILRKNSIERRFEIVGAFHNHQCEAYKNFLKAITCYDLAPQHGMIIMLDASLSIHKAVSIMCLHRNSGHRAAIVCNAKNKDRRLGIFTITDCLKCLQLGVQEQEKLGDETLQFYLDTIQCKKKMVTVSASAPVWDVSRLFRLNRVHRIPVLQENEFGELGNEVLSFVCLRAIFVEILKLMDSKCALTPNLHSMTLDSLRLGTWTNIAWIGHNATCGEAIAKFLTRKVSCLPLLDDEQNFMGSVTKENVIEAVAQRPNNYQEVLDLKVQSIIRIDETLVKVAKPETTIEDAIRMLVHSNIDGAGFRQCLFVVKGSSLLAVVSYADIMDFLLNTNSMT